MTLKVHTIVYYYMWYFVEMGTNFHDTNGEYVEAVHYSLDGHEEKIIVVCFCKMYNEISLKCFVNKVTRRLENT